MLLSASAEAQRLVLPPRPPDAPSGTVLAHTVETLDLAARENRIVAEILRGNVPMWLRDLRPVEVESETDPLTFWTTPDYLAVGSDADYLLVPLSPGAAQRIADSLGMSLPTPRMVDAIWTQAEVRLAPAPIPPSPAMTTVSVFLDHAITVATQRQQAGVPMGALVAGHKKDVVVSRGLATQPGHVAIYGWHQPDGAPIQPLYLGHTADWVDYSHGIRLVSRTLSVGGEPVDLWDALRDPALAPALSHQGVVDTPRYPQPDD